MENSFGLLLLAIVIIFIIARLLKDAKAFTKYMAIFLVSLFVGAGVKIAVNKLIATTSEKTVIIEKVPRSTYIASSFVLENSIACLDCAGKSMQRSDNFLIKTEGLPTLQIPIVGINDS